MLPSNMVFHTTPSSKRKKPRQRRLLVIPAALLLVFVFSSSSLATPANLLSKIDDRQDSQSADPVSSSIVDTTSPSTTTAMMQSSKQSGLDWARLFTTSHQPGQGSRKDLSDSNSPSSSASFSNKESSSGIHLPSLDAVSGHGSSHGLDLGHITSFSSSYHHTSSHHKNKFHHGIHHISQLPQRLNLHLLSPTRLYSSFIKAMKESRINIAKAGSASTSGSSLSSSPFAKKLGGSIDSNPDAKPWQSYGALYASFKSLLIQAYESDPNHPFSRPIVAAILSFIIFITLKTFELGPCKPSDHQLQVRALLAHRKTMNSRGRSPLRKPLGRSPSQRRRSEKEEPSLLPSGSGNGSYAEMTQNAESLSHCLAARLCRARARSEAKRQKEQEKAEEAMKELAWAEQQQLQQQEKLLSNSQQSSQEEGKLNVEAPLLVRLPSWTDKGPVPLTVSTRATAGSADRQRARWLEKDHHPKSGNVLREPLQAESSKSPSHQIIVEEPEPASRPPSRPCSRASISNSSTAPHRRASISPSSPTTISYPARTLSMSPPPSPMSPLSPANAQGLPSAQGREADGTRSPSPANASSFAAGSSQGQNLMEDFRNLRMRIAEGLRREYEGEGMGSRRQGSV